MSVQIGFVVGALVSALLNLADRIPILRLFSVAAFGGALANLWISLFNVGPNGTLVLRFLTGVMLAGVYPPGMKVVATWTKEDRGFAIGLLVAALTFGSAIPHGLNAVFGEGGMPPWRGVLIQTSGMAIVAAAIAFFLVKPGPHFSEAAPFNWKFAADALRYAPTRLANFGYFGHMWELYAMWTWVPLFLIASYRHAGENLELARVSGFAVIATGALGCTFAGRFADRFGRTTITSISMVVSGLCAVTAGLFFESPASLTVLCLVCGFAVVADSAQFSAAISELADSRYIGTALTMQTSMGFLLTLLTIRIIPPLVDLVGWHYAFMILAVGPAFGIWSMVRLRGLPEATKMASGRK